MCRTHQACCYPTHLPIKLSLLAHRWAFYWSWLSWSCALAYQRTFASTGGSFVKLLTKFFRLAGISIALQSCSKSFRWASVLKLGSMTNFHACYACAELKFCSSVGLRIRSWAYSTSSRPALNCSMTRIFLFFLFQRSHHRFLPSLRKTIVSITVFWVAK